MMEKMTEENNKSKKRKLFEVAQQVDYLSEETIINAINKHSSVIDKYCYILHDKDKYTKEDEIKNPEHKEGTLKKAHFHVFLRLNCSYTFDDVAKWFQVQTPYVNKIVTRYETACLYCIHYGKREKYQYAPEDVKCNFDYLAMLEKYEKKTNGEAKVKSIVSGIESGEIRQYNLHEHISTWEYIKYKSVIEKAFEFRAKKVAKQAKEKQVIFIEGDAGVGKTTYAKKLAEEKKLSYLVAGASNDPLEDYAGEDVLILDDLRGSSQRLEDLLKMLDNNTNSKAKSRYHNKVLECQLIIITTSQDINTFFVNAFSDNPENIKQLKRRCKTYIYMWEQEMEIYMYDKLQEDYVMVAEMENPIYSYYPVQELSASEIDETLDFLKVHKNKEQENIYLTTVEDYYSPEFIEEIKSWHWGIDEKSTVKIIL